MTNCDHCGAPRNNLRLLPTGGGGNAILCHSCYRHEMTYRRELEADLGGAANLDLPAWNDLKPYDAGVSK